MDNIFFHPDSFNLTLQIALPNTPLKRMAAFEVRGIQKYTYTKFKNKYQFR